MHIETLGQGPDLVMIHGWAMHAGIFAPLTRTLRERYTLHLVDLPGHGRSPEREARLDLAAIAARIADATPPAAWLGWSLGGQVCLHAAHRFPTQVSALALIASNPRFVVADDWPHGVAYAVFERFGQDLIGDYRGTLDRFLALECHGSDCAREELRELRAHVFEHGEPALSALEDGLRLLADLDLRALVPSLSMPSLWLAGARDRLVPWQAMQWAAAQTARGRFVKIDGGGHAPFVARPERVLDALLPFLAEMQR
jgi:pimeloyl-[acyl-carrier protein] methyl ester esterase